MADDADAELASARKLPLPDRATHKNWKVRSEVFQELAESLGKVFDGDDATVRAAALLLPKGVADANAAAQDRALDALSAWLRVAPDDAVASLADDVCRGIAAKAFKGRPGTTQRAQEALLELCAAEQANAALACALKASCDKAPKAAAAALGAARACLDAFGPRVVDPKAVLAGLSGPLAAPNAAVRDAAKELALAVAAHVGPPAMIAGLGDACPANVKKDLEAAVTAPGFARAQPSRLTRRAEEERRAREEAGAGDAGDAGDVGAGGADGGGGGAAGADELGGAEDPSGADAYEFAAPKEILARLSRASVPDGEERVALPAAYSHPKWSVRRAAFAAVLEAAAAPRLAEGDYSELAREIRRALAKDANVTVVGAAAAAAGALAAGLRGGFSSHARALLPPLLERFREKNGAVARAVGEASESLVRNSLSLADAVDESRAAFANKNPRVRQLAAELLASAVRSRARAEVAPAPVREPLVAAACAAAADADGSVREAAQALLAAVARRLGSIAALEPGLSALDEGKRRKVRDLFEQEAAAAGEDGHPGAPAKPGSTRGTAVGAVASASAPIAPPAPKTAPGARPGRPAPGGAAARAAAAPGQGVTAPAAPAGAEGSLEVAPSPKPSEEEAEATIALWTSAETVGLLRSAKWQERLEGAEAVREAAGGPGPGGEGGSAGTLVASLLVLPGLSDKNFQVINAVLETVRGVAASPPGGEAAGLSAAHASLAARAAAERLGELKHLKPARAALTELAAAAGPGVVASALMAAAWDAKNPKIPAEALGWAAEAATEFGAPPLGLRAVSGWVRKALESTSAPVRARGLDLAGALNEQVGPEATRAAVGAADLKPALAAALEDALAKRPRDPSWAPTRAARAPPPAGPRASGGAGQSARAAGPADDARATADELLPRVDLRPKLTPGLLGQLSSANWKERAAGVEAVSAAVAAAGGRLQPDLGPDLLPALRARVGDANRNLAARAVQLVGQLAAAVGAPWDRAARQSLLPPLVASLSDGKRVVRDAVAGALSAWLEASGPDRLVAAVAEAGSAPRASADGRQAALVWVVGAVEALGRAAQPGAAPPREALAAALRAAARGSADKSPAVRESGARLAAAVAGCFAPAAVADALEDVKGADRQPAADALARTGWAPPADGDAAPAADARRALGPAAREVAAGAALAAAAAAEPSPAPGRAPARPPALARASAQPSASTHAPALRLLPSSASAANARAERLRQERPAHYEGAPPGEAEALDRELEAVLTPELAALARGAGDARRAAQAAHALAEAARADPPAAAAARDLLLRWCALRVGEASPQAASAGLELAEVLCELSLDDEEGGLRDGDGAAFLPAAIERAGAGGDRLRAAHRAAVRAATRALPAASYVDYLAAGLRSKSARTRAEAAGALTDAVEDDRGVARAAASARSRPLHALAALLASRDAASRAAALSTVEAVASAMGAAPTLRALGPLGEREREILEDRLGPLQARDERVGGAGAAAAALAVPDGAYARGGGPVPTASGGEARDEPEPEPSPPSPGARRAGWDRPEPARVPGGRGADAGDSPPSSPPPEPAPPPAARATPRRGDYAATGAGGPDRDPGFEARWRHLLSEIRGGNRDAAVEAMKGACGELLRASEPGALASTREAVGATARDLFEGVLGCLEGIFLSAAAREAEAETEPEWRGEAPPASAWAPGPGARESARGVKYALNVLLQGLALPEVVSRLDESVLQATLQALLVRLLEDGALLRFEEGPTLVKAVNVLVLKVLESADRSLCYVALLRLLRGPPPGLAAAAAPRFADLVVKCLIKLTRGLAAGSPGAAAGSGTPRSASPRSPAERPLDVPLVLLELHGFFSFLGVDEIRRRSGADDKPLRMAKTVLHELCKLRGDAVLGDAAAAVPRQPGAPQPLLLAYINLNLQTLRASGALPARPAVSEGAPPAPLAPPAPPTSDRHRPPHGHAASDRSRSPGSLRTPTSSRSPALSPSNPRAAASAAARAGVKARLKDAMARLMRQGETDAAFADLRELRAGHAALVDGYIDGTSEMFRAYIRDGLARLDATAAPARPPAGPDAAARSGDASAGPAPESARGSTRSRSPPSSPFEDRRAERAWGSDEPSSRRSPPPASRRPSLSPRPSSQDSGSVPGSPHVSPEAGARLSALRDRLAAARASSPGGGLETISSHAAREPGRLESSLPRGLSRDFSSGLSSTFSSASYLAGSGAIPPSQLPRKASGSSRTSIVDLSQRMAALRRGPASVAPDAYGGGADTGHADL